MGVSIEIWSDVICPWCYVGTRRLFRAVEEFGQPVDIVWHSFQLAPSVASDATDGLTRFRRTLRAGADVEATLERLRATGEREGIVFDLSQTKTASSFDAHRLMHFAQEFGLRDQLTERLFRAHFSEGVDCGDPEELVRLADEVGLPKAQALMVLASRRYADRVEDDQAAASDLGILGLPFFVIGRYLLSGAQATTVLVQVLRRAVVEAERHAQELTPVRAVG